MKSNHCESCQMLLKENIPLNYCEKCGHYYPDTLANDKCSCKYKKV